MGFSLFVFLPFAYLALCSSWIQGQRLPHMTTSDVDQVSDKSLTTLLLEAILCQSQLCVNQLCVNQPCVNFVSINFVSTS
ncbi:hypothetical protein ACFX2A_011516 [Malus domestica]